MIRFILIDTNTDFCQWIVLINKRWGFLVTLNPWRVVNQADLFRLLWRMKADRKTLADVSTRSQRRDEAAMRWYFITYYRRFILRLESRLSTKMINILYSINFFLCNIITTFYNQNVKLLQKYSLNSVCRYVIFTYETIYVGFSRLLILAGFLCAE